MSAGVRVIAHLLPEAASGISSRIHLYALFHSREDHSAAEPVIGRRFRETRPYENRIGLQRRIIGFAISITGRDR